MRGRVLVVEPKCAVGRAMAAILERQGLEVTAAKSANEAMAQARLFDCGVFADELPNDESGIALAGWLLAEHRVGAAVIFGTTTDVDARLRASNLGSFIHRADGLHALAAAVVEAIEDHNALTNPANINQRGLLKTGTRRRR